MNRAIILHTNVTRATLEAIQAAFGASYRLIEVDTAEDVAMERGEARVAMVVIGVDKAVIELPENLHMPTILIARQPNLKQELQALEAGAVDYFSDLAPISVLTARLRNHLSGRVSKLESYIRELELQLTGEQASFYSPERNAHVRAQLEMEGLMRSAIGTGQFVMHYQPKVDVRSGEIVGAEALIRWIHPERGLISPADFIPLAEDTRLIIPIGKWVIDTVCAQQSAWHAQSIPIVPVALNLSAMQFKGSDVLKDVQAALITHGISPDYIELELTETLVMQDPAAAEEMMRSLRDAGLHLSLDDFGTGYSSLAYLKRFPFNSVKIDRAFVTDITTNAGDAAIAKAIIGMGHSLQLNVIAEGVETAEQLALLRESGCDQIQGFYISRPLPADDFGRMLQARESLCEI
jgi:EAL domain-containing protein (putative c-di-GMP-specific phosphodiesterase class I)